jgi:hypothetical protein
VTGAATYVYDGRGARLKKVNANGSSIVYIGGIYEATYDTTGTLTEAVKYYHFAGRNIAVRRVPAGTGSGTLYYL